MTELIAAWISSLCWLCDFCCPFAKHTLIKAPSIRTIIHSIIWTLRAADQKYLESFEMWCWRRMEKISWTDHVRNKEVLLRVNEQRNILHEIRKRKASWIGHILRRNCLLKQVIEGKIKGEMEVTRRRWRRRKKLLDDLNDRTGYSNLKEEALDRTMWRNLLEEALDLSSDRILNEWSISDYRSIDRIIVRRLWNEGLQRTLNKAVTKFRYSSGICWKDSKHNEKH